MSAPPAIPEKSAIHPALRPITSTSISRSWLSAVVWRRSIASVATWTAVANPMQASVPDRSLSIVLGIPTTGTPSEDMLRRRSHRPLTADRDERVDAEVGEGPADALDALLAIGVGAGRAEDRPAPVQDPLHRRRGELDHVPVHHTAPAAPETDDLEAVHPDGGAHDGADRRVESGRVPACREDADACGHWSLPRCALRTGLVDAVREPGLYGRSTCSRPSQDPTTRDASPLVERSRSDPHRRVAWLRARRVGSARVDVRRHPGWPDRSGRARVPVHGRNAVREPWSAQALRLISPRGSRARGRA